MKITNKKGKTVLDKTMFTGVDKMMVYNGLGIPEMELTKEYDLANFTRSVVDANLDAKGDYHCTITAKLNTGDTLRIINTIESSSPITAANALFIILASNL
jgi:hypothetical protein